MHFNVYHLTPAKKVAILKIAHELNLTFIIINEAGAKEDPELMRFPGFDHYYRPRSAAIAASGGGLGIWIRKAKKVCHSLIYTTPANSPIEAMTVRVKIRKQFYQVTGVYIPERNLCTKDNLETILPPGEEGRPNEVRMMLGDFNVHNYAWDKTEDEEGKTLRQWALLEGFIPFNNPKVSTRIADRKDKTQWSSPDVSFISGTGTVMWKTLHKVNISDHVPVIVELLGYTAPAKLRRTYYSYKNAAWDEFTQELERDPDLKDRELNLYQLMQKIHEVAKKHIPRGRANDYDPLHSDRMKEADAELQEAIRVHREADADRAKTWEALKGAKKKCGQAYLAAREENVKELIKQAEAGDAKAWRRISLMTKKTANESGAMKLPPDANGNVALVYDDEEKANAWAEIFKEVATSSKGEDAKAKPVDFDIEDYRPYLMSEMEAGIKQLKNNRAVGKDEISAEMLKHLGPTAKIRLLAIINKSLTSGNIPIEWKTGIICPVWKDSKPANELKSYRPVTLTSHMGKLAERMIARRIVWQIASKFSHRQYGFRAGRSTADALYDLAFKIHDAWNEEYVRTDRGNGNRGTNWTNNRVISILIDFSSAFDTLDHETIIQALLKKGVNKCEAEWVRNFITARNTRVRFKDAVSKNVVFTQGVPQGTVLGPLLFIVVLDDLLEKLEKDVKGDFGMRKTPIHTLAFADDLTLTISFSDPAAACKEMNRALRTLENWTKDSGLRINPKKTQGILWTSATNGQTLDVLPSDCQISLRVPKTPAELAAAPQPEYKLKHIYLEDAKVPNPDPTADKNPYPGCVKLLGGWLDRSLCYHQHAKYSAEKAAKSHNKIALLTGKKIGCSFLTTMNFIEAIVKSKLVYPWDGLGPPASETSEERLDRTYRKFARKSSGAASTSDDTGSLIEAGLWPISSEILPKFAIAHMRRRTGDDGIRQIAEKSLRRRQHRKAGEKVDPADKAERYIAQAHAEEGRELPKKRQMRLTRSALPPWEAVWDDRICITATLGVEKKSISEEEQLKVSMDAIDAQKAKKTPYLVCYTDGSGDHQDRETLEWVQRSGAAYVILLEEDGSELGVGKFPAGAFACSYSAETVAFHELLQTLDKRTDLEGKHILLCLDTQSLLTALLAGPHLQKCIRTDDIWRLMISLAKKGCTLALQHVFSHCQVPGNTRADALAAIASLLNQESVPVEPRDVKALIKRKMKRDRKQVREADTGYRAKNWGTDARKKQEASWPREQQVFTAQLRLGQSRHVGTFARIIDPSIPDDCRGCNKKPPIKLKDTIDRLDEEGRYHCPHCDDYSSPKMPRVNAHIEREHPEGRKIKSMKYRCPEKGCNTQYQNYQKMVTHYKEEHKKECEIVEVEPEEPREAAEVPETIKHLVNDCPAMQYARDHVVSVNASREGRKQPVPSKSEAMAFIVAEATRKFSKEKKPAVPECGPYYEAFTLERRLKASQGLVNGRGPAEDPDEAVSEGMDRWLLRPRNADEQLRLLSRDEDAE